MNYIITSGEEGSISLNFAVRQPGFNIDTNFNIYDLEVTTGKFILLRLGKADQKPI